jgi:adenosyl cobinamide kinase/adenosyl cobinamide phosphate guanylyltransferase
MLTVLLGGARSGKSALAEQLGREHAGPVTYIATCPRIEGDTELADRIERHRAARPSEWTTIEEQLDLARAIQATREPLVIVDCLTTWVGNLLHHGWAPERVLADCDACLVAAQQRSGTTIVVSNEVGLGIVPGDPATREYRDLLGQVNRLWVARADRALLLVAGRALALHDPYGLLG